MATEVFGGVVPHLFPSLGPALMVSMGYIDLGKWVAAVEGGARFGFDLVSLVLFFNCTAILCQYLATCIGMVTGKNLAEICSQEYSKWTCILLGIQAEISMITSETTMVLGIAHGLNLLFGIELVSCIFLATASTVLLPLFVTTWDNIKAEAFYTAIAAVALVFYVLGVLISQPEFPLAMNGVFPKLNGQSAYSLMALLGSNIMVHNFYIHSSSVQQQSRQIVTVGSLFNDHFFAILSIFTGIFLVNYVLMNSAATVFSNTDGVVNLQDLNFLMDQIFKSPIAPVAFFLVLFFSSQITALNWNIGGQVILRYFFGINLSVWAHHGLLKALAIIPALYYARNGGSEGIYQLLIFCQIILAMLLPSSVIPLFRVASSKCTMGRFKIPWYMEIFSLIAFFGMLASNMIFIVEALFGRSNWISNMQSSTGSSVIIPSSIIFLVAFTSVGLTLYLAVTPLKSASERPDIQIFPGYMQSTPELFEVVESDDMEKINYEEDQGSIEDVSSEKFIENQGEKLHSEANFDVSETIIDSDHESHQSTQSHQSAYDPGIMSACSSPAYHTEKSNLAIDEAAGENSSKVTGTVFPDVIASQEIEAKYPIEKDVEVSTDVQMDKNNEEEGAPLAEDVSRGILPYPSVEGSGSLSKLSGLGRAARRQLSAVLDEFWGHLFDYHGKLTQEATTRRLDVLLGIDSKLIGSSVKADAPADELSKSYFPDLDRSSIFQSSSREFSSPRHGVQMESRPYSQTMQTLDAHAQNSYTSLFGSNDRHSLYPPQSSDNRDYQPATIHGYQLSSYLKGASAGRAPYSSNISLDLPPTSSASSFIANCRDPLMYGSGQNDLGSLRASSFQNRQATSTIGRLPVDRSFYEASLLETGESSVSSAYGKKYHSSPDVSAIIASIRNSSLNDGNAQWAGPIGSRPSTGRMTYEQSQYLNPLSTRTGVPLAFDQLSPPKLHRDVFSPHSSLNSNTRSLWFRQPSEQLFGVIGKNQSARDRGVDSRPNVTAAKEAFSYTESETKLLQYFRICMMKLLKLEGSDWLFRQGSGIDEELIDRVAAKEKYLQEVDSGEINQAHMLYRRNSSAQRSEEGDPASLLSVTNCGDGCIWRAALVVSFGVWCIRRILELSVVESRPELWGKYTYVLNRLQGILEPAFLKSRPPLFACSCLEINTRNSSTSPQNGNLVSTEKTNKATSVTTANMVLDMIKDVEAAVSGRKGRTGTAAGDVAFPKGKENLVSVLKRYKRRLLNKSSAGNEGGSSSRRIPSPISSSVS
ncbi:protein ETHYLENE-INSENSITIVE 2-like isoform X1 [Dioscorea cayenensis subsp. rotundata]|uniref:Protein ETHYLENE-INSENSITIVE 2-like isoform X1 n=1 Tax=Dioscorea cayennensis subsp. rotundata TaxID=55577 RepID=A0AB40CN24_DIOCR|nr:protein ETHYLENE-INSENSITIVE 2-like isoform X1 [Dioscorea cayenensis subsp. rotundata]XP_039140943.1 protein ETHYLENE-INSENSITIVE 2-like isoform X1 [Dioscorea cayenensis subsp. rotundata]